jgi:hypothetical protein
LQSTARHQKWNDASKAQGAGANVTHVVQNQVSFDLSAQQPGGMLGHDVYHATHTLACAPAAMLNYVQYVDAVLYVFNLCFMNQCNFRIIGAM